MNQKKFSENRENLLQVPKPSGKRGNSYKQIVQNAIQGSFMPRPSTKGSSPDSNSLLPYPREVTAIVKSSHSRLFKPNVPQSPCIEEPDSKSQLCFDTSKASRKKS